MRASDRAWEAAINWQHQAERPRPWRDEMERHFGDDRLGVMPRRGAGGEWDLWRHRVSTKVKRRLAGGGWIRAGGMEPDRLAQRGGFDTVEEAIEWYVRHALMVMRENRYAGDYNARVRLARRTWAAGSYYEYRSQNARCQGYKSLHEMCVARGWRTRKEQNG